MKKTIFYLLAVLYSLFPLQGLSKIHQELVGWKLKNIQCVNGEESKIEKIFTRISSLGKKSTYHYTSDFITEKINEIPMVLLCSIHFSFANNISELKTICEKSKASILEFIIIEENTEEKISKVVDNTFSVTVSTTFNAMCPDSSDMSLIYEPIEDMGETTN